MNRFVCIHGHFYQPPRENPWLEEIEVQDSAYPYDDWNQRITDECYAPNVASRILGDEGRIIDIVNNYSKMSFNFGPTLLSWLERCDPDVYLAILKADKSSQHFFGGHGSAIAQVYNHMILPLANARDKETQIVWGIRDFESRFKRKPEGMWLAETAVDMDTLEALAAQEIGFTILAPYQAKRFRMIGKKEWVDASDGKIDPRRSYRCFLPSGKDIILFFYDGPISHDIAFSNLLKNGELFAKRFLDAFPEGSKEPVLSHVATDGETYGHHHRFGNMALSYGLHKIETRDDMALTIYAQHLEKHPCQYEVEITDVSSWSCSHGVGRWTDNCGCCIGGHDWHQKWRKPLREALDFLRDELIDVYETGMAEFCPDPWYVRNHYIEVILNREQDHIDEFLAKQCLPELSVRQKTRILKLLELQRHAMLMYTSCGWFFDEISGIETVQILQYAARAIQLAQEVSEWNREEEFLNILEKAPSNKKDFKNGRVIYEKWVRPSVVTLPKVGAHFAIASLFEDTPDKAQVYCFDVAATQRDATMVGRHKLIKGVAKIRSQVTWEACTVDFIGLHFGDYNVSAGVQLSDDGKIFKKVYSQIKTAFLANDIPEVIQLMDRHFDGKLFSLWDLFKNEQGKVLEEIFETTLDSIENHFRGIYDHYYPLMQIHPDVKIPLPKALAMSVEFILNRDIIAELRKEELDFDRIKRLASEIRRWNFTRDKDALSYAATQCLNRLMGRWLQKVRDVNALKNVSQFLKIFHKIAIDLKLWRSQNMYFSIIQRVYSRIVNGDTNGDMALEDWKREFERVGYFLKVEAPDERVDID